MTGDSSRAWAPASVFWLFERGSKNQGWGLDTATFFPIWKDGWGARLTRRWIWSKCSITLYGCSRTKHLSGRTPRCYIMVNSHELYIDTTDFWDNQVHLSAPFLRSLFLKAERDRRPAEQVFRRFFLPCSLFCAPWCRSHSFTWRKLFWVIFWSDNPLRIIAAAAFVRRNLFRSMVEKKSTEKNSREFGFLCLVLCWTYGLEERKKGISKGAGRRRTF